MFATAIRPSQALLTGSMVCQGRASKKKYIFTGFKPISVLSNVMTNVRVW
jgi:hypothetical protein